MPHKRTSSDDAFRRTALLTKVTVLQIRAELLRRQVGRCQRLLDEDWDWLDSSLAAMVETTRELTPLILADDDLEPGWMMKARGIPTARLAARDVSSRN